jgi:hypothetical protein
VGEASHPRVQGTGRSEALGRTIVHRCWVGIRHTYTRNAQFPPPSGNPAQLMGDTINRIASDRRVGARRGRLTGEDGLRIPIHHHRPPGKPPRVLAGARRRVGPLPVQPQGSQRMSVLAPGLIGRRTGLWCSVARIQNRVLSGRRLPLSPWVREISVKEHQGSSGQGH